MHNRQADADLSVELKAEAKALSLRGKQGIADFVAHGIQDAARVLAAQDLNVLNRYRKGEVAAYLRFHISGTNDQFCLSFRRIPSSSQDGAFTIPDGVPCPKLDGACEGNGGVADPEGDESQVFLGVSNFIECPEGVVPSLVSLVPLKKRTDFRWQILACASDVVPELVLTGAEREFSCFKASIAGSDRSGVTSLVEDGPQIVGGVEQQTWQHLRRFALKLNLVDVLAGLRLLVNDQGPWLIIDKSANKGFEVCDMMFCTLECESSTIEQIGHGEA